MLHWRSLLLVALSTVALLSGERTVMAVYWNADPAFGSVSAGGLTNRPLWFENVHVINNGTNNTRGTAMLLDSQWALTVRHVVQNGGNYGAIAPAGQISVNVLGTVYTGSQVFTPDGGSEMALVRLTANVPGVQPAAQLLNSSFDEPGRILHIGGYGQWGTINTTGAGGTVTGTSSGAVSFHHAYNTGTIAGNGQIQIVANGESLLSTNRLVEGLAGPGDSGGPMFGFYGTNFSSQASDPSQWRIVGLTATSSNPTIWGGASHYTRVAAYRNWLVSTITSRSDLNNDRLVDGADWEQFKLYNLTDLSGLTPIERAARGDLTGDGFNDFADFRMFQSDFNLMHGEGAFAALLASVPEPASGALFALAACWLGARRRALARAARRTLPIALFAATALHLGQQETAQADPPGSGWHLIHADEFSTATVDPVKWDTAYAWGRTHNHDAYMLDSNVTQSGGVLSLTATREATNGKGFSSGVISSHNDFRYTYGYAEMRIKMPSKRGSWPAFWMLDAGWPPEIDVMEYPLFVNESINDQYYANSHWSTGSGNASNGQWIDRNVDLGAAFHTYGLEWTSTQLKYYFDGVLVKTASNQASFQNMYTIFNYAVDGWPGAPSLAQWAAGSSDVTQADWFRVWQKPASVPDTAWSLGTGTSGAWDADANWSNGRARYERQRAYFGTTAARRMAVTWNGSRTVGEVHLDGATAYVLGEAGGAVESLMFADAPDGWALLAVDGGSAGHFINSRLDVWSNLEIRHNGTSPLRLQGDLIGQARPNGDSSTGGIVLFTGAGQTIFAGNASAQRDTRLENGANVQVTGRLYQENTVQRGSAIRISGGSRLELRNFHDSGVAGGTLGFLPNGSSSMFVNDGTLAIAENSQSTRSLTILAGGATVEANAAFEWNDAGAADLVSFDGGRLILAGSGSGVLNKQLNGTGRLTKRGVGRWELRKTNLYQGATIVDAGTLEVTGATGAGAVSVAAGATLGGTGQIAGPLTVAGILAPGTTAEFAALHAGDASFAVGGELRIEINDLAAFDSLAATGMLTIAADAKLKVAFAPASAYVPAAGDEFVIATAAGGVTGAFDQLELPSVTGLAWNLVAAENSFTLKLTAAISADFNLDGVVDGADFLVWQRGASVASGGEPSDGDANGDGIVDGADLEVWRQQYGASGASADAAATVEIPEPSGAVLAVLALTTLSQLGANGLGNRYNVRS
ncbi:family 16 glycosylhydrolase [Lacipirellula sp.]|uniref:family 16 glycosylhydrolase n=1 Tax=Lacipirellula sp. TaxID=2691419 RepID=UPI003D10538B